MSDDAARQGARRRRRPASFRRPPGTVGIALGVLTWNTRQVSVESLAAIAGEAQRLQAAGAEPLLLACDNGSSDGTAEALQQALAGLAVPARLLRNARNLGSSRARNQILDAALQAGADYLLLSDGDLEIVPGSVVAMWRHLAGSPPAVAAIGAHCHGQTAERAQATPYLASLADCAVFDDRDALWVAWTQYGLFRCALFAAGVRFDESPPFDRPGWGCEDVDLAFQIHAQGCYSQWFTGITYLHRAISSSIPLLRATGCDPRAAYEQRRRYVIEKWRRRGLGAHTLDYLASPAADPTF